MEKPTAKKGTRSRIRTKSGKMGSRSRTHNQIRTAELEDRARSRTKDETMKNRTRSRMRSARMDDRTRGRVRRAKRENRAIMFEQCLLQMLEMGKLEKYLIFCAVPASAGSIVCSMVGCIRGVGCHSVRMRCIYPLRLRSPSDFPVQMPFTVRLILRFRVSVGSKNKNLLESRCVVCQSLSCFMLLECAYAFEQGVSGTLNSYPSRQKSPIQRKSHN